MLILTCPVCGVTAEETEFHAGGEAHLKRFGPGSSDEEFESYLFMRENPKGVHLERWRHVNGCGKWLGGIATGRLEYPHNPLLLHPVERTSTLFRGIRSDCSFYP